MLLKNATESMIRRSKIIEEIIRIEKPELLDAFYTYENESRFARKLIDNNLQSLSKNSEIMEVGAGILSLATQLASEGYKVTAIEPAAIGFSSIEFILQKYLEQSKNENVSFSFVNKQVELCNFDHHFDFIYSINVMEHLQNPYQVIIDLCQNLTYSGKYQFYCPNYNFPYEPHFKKFIFRYKNGNFFLTKQSIKNEISKNLSSVDIFDSLNYITYTKIFEFIKDYDLVLVPNKFTFKNLLTRALDDPILSARHSILYKIVKFFSRLKLIKIFSHFPIEYAPVIDAEIRRKNRFL